MSTEQPTPTIETKDTRPQLPPEIQAELNSEYERIEANQEKELAAIRARHKKVQEGLLDMDKQIADMELESAVTFSKDIKKIDQEIAKKLVELGLSGDEIELTYDRERYGDYVTLSGKIKDRPFSIEFHEPSGYLRKAVSENIELPESVAKEMLNRYMPLSRLYEERYWAIYRVDQSLGYSDRLKELEEKKKSLAIQDVVEDLLPQQ